MKYRNMLFKKINHNLFYVVALFINIYGCMASSTVAAIDVNLSSHASADFLAIPTLQLLQPIKLEDNVSLYQTNDNEYLFGEDFSSNEFQKDESEKIFKIGFEFQGPNICPWGKGIKELKTKPIFTVEKDGRKLWDLTIDWTAPEFITAPFSNSEENLLMDCMKSMELSFGVLKKLNKKNDHKKGFFVTFHKWIYGEHDSEENFPLPGKRSRINNNTSIIGLEELLENHGMNLIVLKHEYISKTLEMSPDWEPSLQPQVTIQHKIESNAALMLSLMASKENLKKGIEKYFLRFHDKASNNTEFKFRKALSSFLVEGNDNLFSFNTKTLEIPTRIDKMSGFLFYFNFYCISLAGADKLDEETKQKYDDQIPRNFFKYFTHHGQVNAKLLTTFLLRNPFSEIYKSINTDGYIFKDVYKNRVSTSFIERMSENFNFLSYGEYYSDSHDQLMDLSHLGEYIDNISNEEKKCLEAGVVMLTSVRKFNSLMKIYDNDDVEQNETVKDIFANYFDLLLDSIDNPTTRYDFDPESLSIHKNKTNYDLFSPPYFLTQDDSMGAYKDTSKIDPEYGEVIMEFRGLADIGTYALLRMNLDPTTCYKKFLTQEIVSGVSEKISFGNQALKLFNFVKEELILPVIFLNEEIFNDPYKINQLPEEIFGSVVFAVV